MLHDLLLAVLIVLVSLLYVKFAKLTKAIDGLYKDFEFSLDCIDKKLKEIISDVANSQAKLQDRICNLHEFIETIGNNNEKQNNYIIDRLGAHDNYVIAHNKETRPLLSELLEAIQASKTSESKDTPAENTNEVKRPKTAIRRNKRKYTKDTEEVKE